jgi:hypothetical protein
MFTTTQNKNNNHDNTHKMKGKRRWDFQTPQPLKNNNQSYANPLGFEQAAATTTTESKTTQVAPNTKSNQQSKSENAPSTTPTVIDKKKSEKELKQKVILSFVHKTNH